MAGSSEAVAVDRLRSIGLFAELDDTALGHIAETASEFEVEAGHVLVQPNMEASGLFLIEEGRVAVEAPGHHFERGPGESVGELALLVPDMLRTARVQAKTPVRGIACSRAEFEQLLAAQPGVAVGLLRVLARRLAEATGT